MKRHEARIRRSIHRLLLVSATVPAAAWAAACDETIDVTPAKDASVDATVLPDSEAETDTGIATYIPDSSYEAPTGACAPVPYDGAAYLASRDGGSDADAAPDLCATLVRFPCGLPPEIAPRANCYITLADCDKVCPGAYFNCHGWDDSCIDGSIATDAPVTVDCVTCPGGAGRKPRGLVPARHQPSDAVGRYLQDAAHLEAASVHAFRSLARELRDLGAPTELVRAAAAARRDETRHARVLAQLARRAGTKAPRARIAPSTPKRVSLETFAIENAVEGCVRETFGALLASWQAEHATDRHVAKAMARIAGDETKHAALAWAIAEWLDTRLDEAARARVRLHAEAALAELEQTTTTVPEPVRKVLGVPDAVTQRHLARGMRADLWRTLAAA